MASAASAVGRKDRSASHQNQPTDEIIRQTQQAMALCAQHGATLILNDYWQTAIDLGCDFVHLGQEDLAGSRSGSAATGERADRGVYAHAGRTGDRNLGRVRIMSRLDRSGRRC